METVKDWNVHGHRVELVKTGDAVIGATYLLMVNGNIVDEDGDLFYLESIASTVVRTITVLYK